MNRQPSAVLARTMANGATAEWERVLGEYAESLDEQRAILLFVEAGMLADERVPSLAPFTPPAELPPLPDALRPWARSLLETTAGLSALAAKLSSRAQRELSGRPARLTPPALTPPAQSRWEALL